MNVKVEMNIKKNIVDGETQKPKVSVDRKTKKNEMEKQKFI